MTKRSGFWTITTDQFGNIDPSMKVGIDPAVVAFDIVAADAAPTVSFESEPMAAE